MSRSDTTPSFARCSPITDVGELNRGILLAVTDVLGRGRLLDLGAILDSRLRSIAKEWIPSGTSAERQEDGCDGHPCESSQSHSPHSVDKSYRLIDYKGGNSRLKLIVAIVLCSGAFTR